jgi:hypothetical protein
MATLALAAEPVPAMSFVESLDTAARQAIGVDAMTPAQRDALEKAVDRYLNREVTKSTKVAVAAAVETVRAEQAAEESKGSFLQRAKVLLTPGTEIEYARVETTLTEPFKGWKSGQLFRLANGQTWRVTEGAYWAPREPEGKGVAIEPGALGSFFLKFEGISKRARAELVGR